AFSVSSSSRAGIRVRTQLGPPEQSGCKHDASEEVAGELVIAGGDPAKILEPTEHPLDQIALAVGARVVGEQRLAAPDRWDDRLDCSLREQGAQRVCIICFV